MVSYSGVFAIAAYHVALVLSVSQIESLYDSIPMSHTISSQSVQVSRTDIGEAEGLRRPEFITANHRCYYVPLGREIFDQT